jgi:hypothetical protein
MIWTIVLFVLAGLGIVLTPVSILLVRELFGMGIERDGLRIKLLEAATRKLPQETSSDTSLSRPYRSQGENGAPPVLPPTSPRRYRNGELVCELSWWQYTRFLCCRSNWDADPDGVIVRVGKDLLRNGVETIFRSDSAYDFRVGPNGVVVHQNNAFFHLDGRVISRGRCVNWSPHEEGIIRVIDNAADWKFWLNDQLIQFVDTRKCIRWGGGAGLTVLYAGKGPGHGIELVFSTGGSKLIYPDESKDGVDLTHWYFTHPNRLVVQLGELVLSHDIQTGAEQVLYNGPLDEARDHPEGVIIRRGRRFYFYDGGAE